MRKPATNRRTRKFDSVNAKIIELVGNGETLIGACEQVGVNPHTCRNWVSSGRRDPGGPYAELVRGLDAARTDAQLNREEELEDYSRRVLSSAKSAP
jgi:transposase-like protein